VRVRLVDDPRAEVGEDVRVGVGAVECQLDATRGLDVDVDVSRRFLVWLK